MSKLQLHRSPALALLATLAATGCGGPALRMDGDVDPYNGVIDNTFGAPNFTGTNFTAQGALALQFQPTTPGSSQRPTCNGNTSCYLPQTGWVNGQPISFFNAGLIKPLPFATLPSYVPASCAPSGMGCVYAPSMAAHRSDGGGGWRADVFPHSCKPGRYDPVADAYPREEQYPIVDALPVNNLTNTSALPPLGVVAVYSVTGVGGETCNDLKYASSIGSASSPGHFGAKRGDKPSGYEVWYLFDPTVSVFKAPGPNAAPVAVDTLWFNGLQANYLSGGPVPTDAQGNLVAMDGVVLGTSTAFGDPTANGKVLLPWQPGDDGYSPIVRLHDYKTSTSGLNAICPLGATCTNSGTTKYVKMSDAVAAAFNTILIVASPQ